MMECKWRAAYASVIGSSHQKNGTVCQDAGRCQILDLNGEEILLAIVSDGAGSSSRSDVGSKLVVDSFFSIFEESIRNHGFNQISRGFVLDWLKGLQGEIQCLADVESLQLKEFFCTLVAAIIGPQNSIFFQIGDGAVVAAEPGSVDYYPVFWPQHGEFANQTNFLFQENIEETLEFESNREVIDRIALFTDGIERLVLNFSSKSAHSPAFQPIFEWLAKCEPSRENSPSEILNAYLCSDLINSRTDDDKTLVMATRTLS